LLITSLSALLTAPTVRPSLIKSYPFFPERRKEKYQGREREKESGKIELETSMTMATEEAKVVEESPSEKRSEETEGEVSVELSAPSGWKKV
jgi:hypothetical protein